MKTTVELILFVSLLISTIIAGYVTFQHIIMKRNQRCYDSWLFPALFALLLQSWNL
jgi:hypothetical protein